MALAAAAKQSTYSRISRFVCRHRTTGTGVRLFNDAICDDCQRRVLISCVRRQASDPWLILTTVGESGDESLPGPLPDVHRIVGNVKLIFRWLQLFLTAAAISFREQLIW